MARSGFLGELLENLLSRGSRPPRGGSREEFGTLFDQLLLDRGDIPALRTASEILSKFDDSEASERDGMFQLLADRFDIDAEAVESAARAYRENASSETYRRLQAASEAPRQELLRRLNRVPGGTLALVRMRAYLLQNLEASDGAAKLDADFRHLLASWFNRGFLVLRQIDWTTPANILEKIIAYEAVHEISSWDDLRDRLQPADRRCFAYFHPAVADEPLVFVEVALTSEAPTSIDAILGPGRTEIDPDSATTAVFYSISNCQAGLQGVSFGNFLIKQVAEHLRGEFPRLKEFVTISPVPGFARWLGSGQARATGEYAILEKAGLADPASASQDVIADNANAVAALAAAYLLSAKRDDGKPRDPVARFHLANGAILDRVNPAANLSPRGIAESLGVMVNYRYDLAKADANNERYFETGEVTASKAVRDLAP